MTTPYATEIRHAALTEGLDPKVVTALVFVESGGNPWAWNPEPRYPYLWNVRTYRPFRTLTPAELVAEIPPADFPVDAGDRDQEWWAQQASWGLMQIMGAVAREVGFTGPYLTALCDPIQNLTFGCRHLSRQLDWAHGDLTRALAAWNGGHGGNDRPPYRNIAYAERVLAAVATVNI